MSKLQEKVTAHLIEKFDDYTAYHGGNPDQLVFEATEFFNNRNFTADVVDVIICATANALEICMKIYRRSPAGNIQIYELGNNTAARVVHLKLSGTGGTATNKDYTGDNHYDALTVKFKESPTIPDIDLPEMTEPTEDVIDLTSPLKKRPRLSSINLDDFVDLTESPMKIPPHSDTEVGGVSQSEDERASFFSDIGEVLGEGVDDEDTDEPEASGSWETGELQMDPEEADSLIRQYLRPATIFPTKLFRDVRPKKCNFLPPNIDGNKYYKVKCTAKNYTKKTSDRRWFVMRTSSKTGLYGIRKTGHCHGSWICANKKCSFSKTEKKPNNWHFEYRGGSRACYSCGTYAAQVPCQARKLIELPHGAEYAKVYHIGKHECTLRPEVVSDLDYTAKWIQRYPGVTYKDLKSTAIQSLLDAGDAEEAENAAYRITTQAFRKIKRGMNVDPEGQQVETQSLEAVAILKRSSDKIDPLHIYKINSKAMNNQPDFVVKSSSKILTIALKMDQDAEENPLQLEDAFFDGCHSRVTGFILLGLWVQHPAMRRVIRLASMEVRSESTQDIAMFFTMLNEMLRQVGKKKEDYKFNPRYIMCDEAGGNITGIREALGLVFAASRVITCQWHFRNAINEKIHKIGEKDQEAFLADGCQLCKVHSVAEFELLFAKMREVVKKYPEFGDTLEWYHARRFHLFPAFREGLHSGLNLAEVGNAQWKPRHKLSLVAAAKDDITTMLQQETDLRKFGEGSHFKRGQVATDTQRATREKRRQMEEARSFAQVLQNEEALRMQMESEENPDYFIPGKKAGHKPGKKSKGVEGETVKGKGRGKGRGKAKETPTLDELLEKLNRAKRIERGEDVPSEDVREEQEQPQPQPSGPVLGSGPEPRKVRPIKSTENFPNHPAVVHSFYNVSKCQGCPEKIDSSAKAPHDLFFRMKAIRPYQNKDTLMWHDKVANAYFHLNAKCLQKFDSAIKLEDIQMSNEMFYGLSDAHLKHLAELGLLKFIIANKGKEVE